MQRPLLLWGFMGTGKSTVGRRVAALAGAPFEDLDARIEARAGERIADIFQTAGEAEFRRLEREELERVLERGGAHVVALGGGALLGRAQRLAALERATVVTLRAPVDVIAARTAVDDSRPLLSGRDPTEKIQELLDARAVAYAECHDSVDTGAYDVDAAAEAAFRIWQRAPVAVAAGERSYSVDVGTDLIEARLPALVGSPTGSLLVTDRNVAALHADRIRAALPLPTSEVVVEPGEQHKTLVTLEQLWSAAANAELDRHGLFVALGGGVVSDMAGLAAATWLRGTRWVALPTTLLGMVDASVGGKTAVDFADAKNAIGAFWQPSGVICDMSLLQTEPERGFVSALAEVVKTALLGDAELFELIEQQSELLLGRDPDLLAQVVRRCVAVKAAIVSRDERESGLRAVLNLGHTLGHALESGAGYSTYTHGEAVALGLVLALRIGVGLAQTPVDVATRAEALLGRLGLPTRAPEAALGDAVSRVGKDKKRRGTYIRFVVVRGLGAASVLEIPLADMARIVGVAHAPLPT